MQEFMISAADGYKLSALFGTPVGDSIGTIVVSSATGIKKEFYIHFARYLIQNGYNVLLFDYRGIGGSAPEDLRTSDSYMHEWGTMDMNAVVNFLVKEKKLTGIIWVGHSVGAQLIGFLEERQHIRKVVAISAALGYWGYFPFPVKWLIWGLWFFVGPLMVKVYGYGAMQRIGWGENLPKNMMREWRAWCLSKVYFTGLLKTKLNTDKFYQFTTPITAIYISDDYIANDQTVPLMMKFFPNAPQEIIKLPVEQLTTHKVGHIGIFRKKFEQSLWPLLVHLIEQKTRSTPVRGIFQNQVA